MAKGSTKKNYIRGSSKLVKFENGGQLINLDLNVADLNAIANSAGYAKITLSLRSEPDQYGNTHTIFQNEFKPEPREGKVPASSGSPKTVDYKPKNKLPF